MKQISVLTFLVTLSLAVFAQNVDFGLKGGLNLASLSINGNSSNYQNRVGFNGGLFAEIHASPQISVQPELLYSSEGTKYYVGNYQYNLALNYINIPLMLKANVGSGLYAQAGPQLGFLTSISDKVNGVETNDYVKQDFKNTDVALGFGLGFSSTSGLGVDARYNLGISNINNFGTNNDKNNVLQLDLTYKFSSANSGGRPARRRY